MSQISIYALMTQGERRIREIHNEFTIYNFHMFSLAFVVPVCTASPSPQSSPIKQGRNREINHKFHKEKRIIFTLISLIYNSQFTIHNFLLHFLFLLIAYLRRKILRLYIESPLPTWHLFLFLRNNYPSD